MRIFAALLRRLGCEESGATAVIAGITMTVLLGFGALAIDASNIYLNRALLQNAADSAARAAIIHLTTPAEARALALLMAEQAMPAGRYGNVLAANDIDFGTWDPDSRTFTEGPDGSGNAVRVIARRSVPLTLAAIFGLTRSDQAAQAIAASRAGGFEVCMLALSDIDIDPAESELTLSGNVDVYTPHCGMASNASMRVNGNVDVDTLGIHVVGTLAAIGNVDINTTHPTVQGGPRLADPYAGLPGAAAITAGMPVRPSPSHCNDLQPNVVYSNRVSFSGSMRCTLAPGVYYFRAGLSISGNVDFIARDVTLITEGSFSFSGNGDFDLAGPSGPSGPFGDSFKGMAIYGIGPQANVSLSGNLDYVLNGVVYLPQADLSFTGNQELLGCSQIVASTITLRGNSDRTQQCRPVPTTPIMTQSGSALVQ